MLTENEIVTILANYLSKNGYVIRQTLTTIQTGIDLIAENGKEVLYVEAKARRVRKRVLNVMD